MKSQIIRLLPIVAFALLLIFSHLFHWNSGEEISRNFSSFLMNMLKILPCAFILISLFDVWIKKQTVEKHFSGIRGYFYMILLAGTTVGGLYVALPFAHTLQKKGASWSIVFTYLFAAAIVRIPMTVFEASFLGFKFTLIRLLTSLPLIVLASLLLEKLLKNSSESHRMT